MNKKNNFNKDLDAFLVKKCPFLDVWSLSSFLPKSSPKNKIPEFMQESDTEMK